MRLLHPLPEARITDSRERVRQYPPLKLAPHLDYHLARARIIARYAGIDADAALDWFARSEKKIDATLQPSIQYGKAPYAADSPTTRSFLVYTSPSPRDKRQTRMPSSA